MSPKSALLKAAIIACTTVGAASAASAEAVTVYVYEKGYFPNIAYMDDATQITFVNKTDFTVGLDYATGSIMVNSMNVGSSVTVNRSSLTNKPLKTPYVFGKGYYNGMGFAISSEAAPTS